MRRTIVALLAFAGCVTAGADGLTASEHRIVERVEANVIPREVQVEGDIRFLTPEQFERARSRMTAIVAQDPGERGAGDISFVCDGRLACLDGLGAMGENDHAPGEYVELGKLPMLTQRAALLIYRLTR